MKILFVIYDNESFLSYFPMGVGYLAAALRKRGYTDISIFDQAATHKTEAELGEYLTANPVDVVGVGVIGGYFQYQKLLSISKTINALEKRPYFVLGGHGPSPEPEYFLKITGADAIVMGEGEVVGPNLMDALSANKDLANIKGIAYRKDEEIHVNGREELIKDVNSIEMPAWDLFDMSFYTMMRGPGVKATEKSFQIITGRGCPFKCNFCYRMNPGFRPRSVASVVEEIKVLKEQYGVTFFDFTDDLMMSSKARTIEFCDAFMRERLNIRFICEGRLNYAVPEVLAAMKKAGCVFINYGIESVDDEALKAMNKSLTVKQIIAGVENTIAADLHPGLNIIWGNIGEDEHTLKKGVDFLLKYNTYAQLRTIRPVTPYPGSPLYYYAIEQGLLDGPEDFYTKKHLNSDLLAVNFTRHSDEEFHQLLYEANLTLLNDYFSRQKSTYEAQMKELYFDRNVNFRGFRQT